MGPTNLLPVFNWIRSLNPAYHHGVREQNNLRDIQAGTNSIRSRATGLVCERHDLKTSALAVVEVPSFEVGSEYHYHNIDFTVAQGRKNFRDENIHIAPFNVKSIY